MYETCMKPKSLINELITELQSERATNAPEYKQQITNAINDLKVTQPQSHLLSTNT